MAVCLSEKTLNNQASLNSSVIPSVLNSEVCWEVNLRGSSWPLLTDMKRNMLNTEILDSFEEQSWHCCLFVVPISHQPCWIRIGFHPLWPEEIRDVLSQHGGLSSHHGYGTYHCQDVFSQPDGWYLSLCRTVGMYHCENKPCFTSLCIYGWNSFLFHVIFKKRLCFS